MCKLAYWACRTGHKSCVVSQMECVRLLVVYDSGWVLTQLSPNRDGMACQLKDANPSTRGTKTRGHRVLGCQVHCCSDSHPSKSWAWGQGRIQHLPHSCQLGTCPAQVTEQWLGSWVVGQLQLPHQHRRNTILKEAWESNKIHVMRHTYHLLAKNLEYMSLAPVFGRNFL